MAAEGQNYAPKPGPVQDDPKITEVVQWAQRELEAISRQFTNFNVLQQNELFREPEKPRIGMTVYADGVHWDPGDGPGQYVYDGAAWVLSSTGLTDTSNFLTKTGNLSDVASIAAAQDNLNLQPGVDVMAYDPQLTAKIRMHSITANTTLALTDAEKCILIQGTTAGQTLTIPTFASVALGQGTAISIANYSSQSWTLAGSGGVTISWSPSLSAGSRTLASGSVASILALFDDYWTLTGTGIT